FPNDPKFAYCFNIIIIPGFMVYLGFIRSFLNLDILMPKWDKILKYFFWLGIPFTVIHVIVTILSNYSYGIADYIPISYIVFFLPLLTFFLYPLYRTNDVKGKFIIVGTLMLLVGIFFNILLWAEVFDQTLLDLKVGFILEILIFSIGLAYRDQENIKAKEQADFQLVKTQLLHVQEQAEIGRLKEMDNIKSKLYTNITHEFRTPLTVIMGMNENITGHIQEKNLIRRNSKNLLRLINQLLDLSKAESSNLKVVKINGDIVSFIQYLTESFYSMASDKGIKLTFYTEEETLIMDYDETLVQHIFYNLLSNAIKFTEENGKIVCHLCAVEIDDMEFIKIKIQDTGIGIPEEVLPHIFDRFYQVDNSSTRRGEGTGIGLALVMELLQLMNGKIDVVSKLGKGTEFVVFLPIENDIKTKKESASKINMKQNIPISLPILPSENNALHETNHPILLIIEDNKDVIEYIESILQKNYNICISRNGQLGIDKAIEIIPDIILSDVMMPIKDGYEVCDTLKKDERTSHIPIILLTAKATLQDRLEGLKYGADAFLTKPFNKEELLVRLKKLTELRKELHARYAERPEVPFSLEGQKDALPFTQKLRRIVIDHFDDPDFGVSDLGNNIHMSDMQVYRKLKALTDQTPSSFIRSVRLQKATLLLKETDLSISDIAYSTGFNTPNYFSRIFNQRFKMSPSEYRHK
ncbi:MAG: ATP-binding protein, partial [Saprospiraceae bacterium]